MPGHERIPLAVAVVDLVSAVRVVAADPVIHFGTVAGALGHVRVIHADDVTA